jgi:hypothetical protein
MFRFKKLCHSIYFGELDTLACKTVSPPNLVLLLLTLSSCISYRKEVLHFCEILIVPNILDCK